MEHDLGSRFGEDPRHLGRVADVCLVQDRAAGKRFLEVLALARREVVDHRDAIAAGDQGVDEIGADEPGSACDEAVQSTGQLARNKSGPCRACATRARLKGRPW